jgi:hypothetical protein
MGRLISSINAQVHTFFLNDARVIRRVVHNMEANKEAVFSSAGYISSFMNDEVLCATIVNEVSIRDLIRYNNENAIK